MIFSLTISFTRSFLPIGAIHKGRVQVVNAALSRRVEIIDQEITGVRMPCKFTILNVQSHVYLGGWLNGENPKTCTVFWQAVK